MELAEKMYQLYKEGMSFRAIAKELGCTHSTVSKYLKKYTSERGLDFPINHYGKYSIEKMYQLYKEGMSFRAIAKELGCGHSDVSRNLKKYTSDRGLDFSINPYKKYSDEKMYQLYKEGMSFRAIAKEIGCDHCLVSRYLKKYTSERGLDFPINVCNTLPMEEIFKYYSLGISSVDIGKMYNCSCEVVMKNLRKYISENNIDYEIVGRNSAKKKYYIAFLLQIKEIINEKEEKNKERKR